MKLIIEVNGQRRLVSGPFRIYGDVDSLKALRTSVDNAIIGGMSVGWVDIGAHPAVPDVTLYPWDSTADEKPTYPWTSKGV